MSKILTLAATGVAGLVLGAGIGVAAADQGSPPVAPEPAQDVSSMGEMHDAMRDQMPAELVDEWDQMHDAMGDGDHASMMGSMMSGMQGGMPAGHAEHHPGTEG
ncbi:MAG: hypothetical protein ACLGIZ_16470 [Acidimicrobiia bacterium]